MMEWLSAIKLIKHRHHCLYHPPDFQFKEIERRTGEASYQSIQPDFVFEVIYNKSNTLSARFDELSQMYTTLYAYHGSALDNFHSILHNGLHAHLNKVSCLGIVLESLASVF